MSKLIEKTNIVNEYASENVYENMIQIIEVSNNNHDCVIDIPDSQPDSDYEILQNIEENVTSDVVLNLEEKRPKIIIEKAVKQLCKGQDLPCCGKFTEKETGKKGDFVAVYDGHGGNGCIDFIRTLDQEEIMSEIKPVDFVVEKIMEYRKKTNKSMKDSGSTFVYAKIFTEDEDGSGLGYIHIGNVADSELVVYINGERIYMTTPQISTTPGEMERLKRENRVDKFAPRRLQSKPFIHADDKITMEDSYSINFCGMKSIVPSQSLGHNELTGYNPEYKILTFDLKKDYVKIVCASDGLWDILNLKLEKDEQSLITMGAESLASLAERLWKQEWKYCYQKEDMNKFKMEKFPEYGYDDIGVCTYEYSGPDAKL